MPKTSPLLACTAAILALSACSFEWLPGGYRVLLREGNLPAQAQRERLRVGMSERQVRLLLGEPVLRDPFHQNVWHYILREERAKRQVEESCLVLRFKDGALAGIGEGQRAVSIVGDPQPWCGTQADAAGD